MLGSRLLITCLAFGVLSGCTQQIYYRQGASIPEIQNARDSCALLSQDAAPYRPVTRIVPGRIIPERKVCDAGGSCRIIPAQQSFPEFETIDGNAEKRVLIARNCMAQQGFQQVSLPRCDTAVRQSVPVGVTRTLPRISETSCIISRGSGAYQIVTP